MFPVWHPQQLHLTPNIWAALVLVVCFINSDYLYETSVIPLKAHENLPDWYTCY